MEKFSRNFIYMLWVLSSLTGFVRSDKSDDCMEVGYARSAGGAIYKAYDELKEGILEQWRKEDSAKSPAYEGFTESMKNVTRAAYLLEEVSKSVLSTVQKTRVGKRCQREWLLRGLEKHVTPLNNIDPQLTAELKLVMSFRCMVGSPYPNVDGTCVSSESPDLGAVGAKFLRLQPSQPGQDGFSMRSSSSEDGKGPLPSARAVSRVLRRFLKAPSVTQLFTEWSHFLQQDIFDIPTSPYAEGVDCCADADAPDCAPIAVPEADPLYSSVKCFNYRRSARAQAIVGHRESFSKVSTYLDATPVYGPTNEIAFSHKTSYFGYLRGPEKKECDDKSKCTCEAPNSFTGCFNHEESSLPVADGLRALLILEHNRLADSLAELNPHFDDSLLYNEARRILIAQYSSITYNIFLRLLMGNTSVEKHFLQTGADSPAASYIKEVNPGVLTSYATAAFRNPSMLTEWSKNDDQKAKNDVERQEYFNSTHYNSIKGMTYQDMLAMDVQRARDHGLPGYISWRRFCDPGLVLDSWDDLKQVFSDDVVAELKEVYGGLLEDIDVMAALLEPPIETNSVAGKTFTCIMADQFARLRTGNRLFWEHEDAGFTKEQKEELTNSSPAALLCNNLQIESVPSNPFLPVSEKNPVVKCSEVKGLDLQHWVDTGLKEAMSKINKDSTTPTASKSKSKDAVNVDLEEEIHKGEKRPEETGTGAGGTIGGESSSSVVEVVGAEVPADQPTQRMGGAGSVEGGDILTTTTTSYTTVTITKTKDEL